MMLNCPIKEQGMSFALFKSPFMPFWECFKVFLREVLTILAVANKTPDTPAD